MSVRTSTAFVLAILFSASACLVASVPPMISYQGKITESNGVPKPDGTYSMTFAIYPSESGGTAVWSEVNPSVQVKGGLFSVLLGSINNLGPNIFDSPDRWFAVALGGEPEMTPRQRIGSVAYAVNADNGVPPGTIVAYAGQTAPAGWLICNGQAVSRTAYARLFAAIGTTYGAGDGSSTFMVPNLLGRVPVGYDASQMEFNALNQPGGIKSVTLEAVHMPPHKHPAWTDAAGTHGHTVHDPGHSHYIADSGIGFGAGPSNQSKGRADGNSPAVMWGNWSISTSGTGIWLDGVGNHSHGVGMDNTGGGQAHTNLQPYLVVNYIIKT